MNATLQRRCIEAGPSQHARRSGDMSGLAAMGCAGQREFVFGEAEAIRRARLDQRQCLQRLHRRARIDGSRDVAEREHALPIGIDNRDGALMAALDESAAHDFNENRITHS